MSPVPRVREEEEEEESGCPTLRAASRLPPAQVLASVVRDGGVTIEDLMIELIRHDVDGVATQLASSSGFAKLWTATDAAALQAVYEVPDDAGEWSDDTLLPENASDAPLLAGFDSRTTALARRKLFLRTLRIRMACIAFVTIWFASAERLCVTREAVYIFSSGATCMLWPTELASHRRFTLPLSAVTSLCVWIGVLISYFYSSTSHVNTACTVVHALVCLVTASAWSLGAVLSYRYAYTWAAGRAIMIVDGAAFFTSALALRLLGPPPAYPPGNVSFHLALIRAAIIMTWGTLLSPPNRLRIAKLGQAIGFHHVTLHLGEMTGLGAEGEHAGEDESGDGAQGAADASEDVSFDSNSKSHPD